MKKTCFVLACLMFLGIPAFTEAATNNDYCVNPIFTSNAVKPNILIVMDFSGSMQFPAYLPENFGSYSSKSVALCGTSTISTTSNSSKKYDKTRDYYGYFDTTKYYVQTSSKYYESSCGPDLTDRMGTGPTCISGNFLNWLTATRMDVARKALTGGRFNTGGGATFLESEGGAYVINDYYNNCKYTITADSGTAQRYLSISNRTYTTTCKLNGVSNHNIFTVVPAGVTVEGVVQRFYPKAHMEFMVYSSDRNRVGRLLTAKDSPLSTMVSAINNEQPYGGTPTGEALWEAYDFYKQEGLYSYYNNAAYINKGSQKDPYYDGSTPIWCRKGFVLLISDGVWDNSVTSPNGVDPMRVAHKMRTEDMRSDLTGDQNITTYTIYAFGTGTDGKNAMRTTAMFGGFDRSATSDYPYPYTTWPSTDSRYVNFPLTQCDYPTRWDAQCVQWDKNKSNLPYNYFEADDGNQMASQLEAALLDMLRRASSGTAASVLASAEGSGANILQAFFFPKRMFDDAEIDWTGEMQNLWYYIDPQIGNSTIREDTVRNNILDIFSDDIIEYEFDVGLGKTKVRRYTPNTSAQKGTEDNPSPVELDEARNLWEAGIMLWARDLATSPRTIYTTVDGINRIDFSTSEASSNGTLQTYLQATGDPTTAQNIVSYVHGNDIAGYRNRTVTTSYSGGTGTNVWKLGDIVSSTPRLKASFPLNSYHLYPSEGYNDRTYYQYVNDVDASGNATGNYKQRGMAFVGANDGMFHAFELGKLTFNNLSANEAARLETVDVPLGTERWAYVPKGALPYLKYLMNTDYCHIYYVNQPTVIVDASVNAGGSLSQDPSYTKTRSSWRTILIGGMGMGGACRDSTSSCSTTSDCVKTPISGAGYSSYFAFDITDPTNPTLLWEFSRDDLGFSTTGPAIVRIGDPAKNGKWFAVFASGPTGPIDTTYHQFMGYSDQNLKFFVLDLLAGPQAAVTVIDTGITNAFGASLANSSFDVDRGDPNASGATPYSDDVIYMGYVKKDGTTWTKGGVLRLMTRNDPNPTNWAVSTVIDNVGPVTTSLTKLQDRKNGKLWLYFGTGRYFYRLNDGLTIDDPDNQQAFYGIIEPCYMSSTNMMNLTCTTTRTVGDLQDQTGSSSTLAPTALGWYINFPTPDSGYKAHRVLAQPVASYNGVVYFLTSSPSTDVCSMGGYTYLWAVWYNNGGAPPAAALSGMVVTQLSTGQIATPILKTTSGGSALTIAGGKAMAVGQGVNIGGGFSLLGPPKPLRKILHMKEK
ncbi:MAG: hypothetical protein GXX82_05720 [Syntrophorhabdus sp.]|nr:hypothetical protein [Syntrophorhabdus sp.]